MTRTVYVGSKIQPMVPVRVFGEGPDEESLERALMNNARTMHNIAGAVLLSEREAAVMIRQWVAEQFAEMNKQINLNNATPFYKQRGGVCNN